MTKISFNENTDHALNFSNRQSLWNKIEMIMASTTFHHSISTNYTDRASGTSFLTQFFAWCKSQQENRLLWLGIALAGLGCILTPLTIFAVVTAGTNLILFLLALIAMSIALVTNLAALPTKITIPALVLSVMIDIAVIIACVIHGVSLSNIF